MTDASEAVQQALGRLSEVSYVAHRDAQHALPAIARHGEAVALAWLDAVRRLYLHDRDAGRAFVHGSRAAERVSEEVLPWTQQALRFTAWRNSWKACEGFMAQLPEAYGLLGHAGEAHWAEMGFRWCERNLESGGAYFATAVRELAGRQGIGGVEHITAPAEELWESRRLALGTYLEGAVKVRNLLGAQAVLPWARRGADILQAGRLRGEAYFRLESEESLQLLIETLPGYRPLDHERFLRLLVDAWFDTDIAIVDGRWSPEKGRPFIETDGLDLFAPLVMPDREEAVLGALHCAGHIAYGSFSRAAVEAAHGEAGARPAPQDSGKLNWRPVLESFGAEARRFELLLDLCEDLRVDCRIASRIPNHRRRLIAAAEARAPDQGAARDWHALALESLRAAASVAAGEEPRWALWNRLAPLAERDATLLDAFRTAVALLDEPGIPPAPDDETWHRAYLPGRSPNAARAAYLHEEAEQEDDARSASEGESGDQAESGTGFGADDEAQAMARSLADELLDELPPEEAGAAGGHTGNAVPLRAQLAREAVQRGVDERGIPYPEWDYRERRYKRNWAWVQERELAEENAGEAVHLHDAYSSALAALKRALQAQRPTRLAPLKRQMDGDEIDVDATVQFVTERRAGATPQPRVYRQRRVQKRDTAVALLADLSTSVMQQLPDQQGRVVDRIRAGILLFAEAMEMVGDAYSIAGFSSKYRDNVSYYLIKDFDQPLTAQTRAVIGGLSGRLATRMGTAIRHALARFDAAPAARRLLLILSDGRPEDYDDGGDIRYLHEDTRMAVKEATDRGVHLFCITVDPAGSEYLPQIFGRGHYLVLDHINSLPRKLPEIYLRLRR